MKIEVSPVRHVENPNLYWTSIDFSSADGTSKAKILAGASEEYLLNSLEGHEVSTLSEEILGSWLNSVVSKWTRLKDEIFDRSLRFDFYTNSEEMESLGIKFLISKSSNG